MLRSAIKNYPSQWLRHAGHIVKRFMRRFALLTLISFLQLPFSIFAGVACAAESGLLWKASSEGLPAIYLFGTIHSDDARVNVISPMVEKALSESDAFALEILPPADTSVYFMQTGRLDSILGAKDVKKIRQLAQLHAMEEEVALTLKPWLLAMIFDQPKPQSVFTLDAKLMSMARRESKPVIALESSDGHFTLLDDLEMREQLLILKVVLGRTEKQKKADFEALLRTYLSGDIQRIARLDDKITGGQLPAQLWQKMRVRLISQRNAEMAQRIIALAKTQSLFVAVGAAHLPEPGGLIDRLRSEGYQVAPVDLREPASVH
jgi:uncharacterized protein YbaP (TraB family)